MNIDQLTAKFAQAYVKRSEEMYNGQPIAKLSPAEVTRAVAGAQNAADYLAGLNPSTAATAGQIYQTQSGPTGVMSGAPHLIARPVESHQDYNSGALYNPGNAGFWSPLLDVPFVGEDQTGFGTGGAALSSAAAYLGVKGGLNRELFFPSSYREGFPRSPEYMTPKGVERFFAILGASPQTLNSNLGNYEHVRNYPLTARQLGRPLVTSDTMDPEQFREKMVKGLVPGPGTAVDLPRNLVPEDGPVSIVATHAAPKGGGDGDDKGARRLQTRAVLEPYTPLARSSRLPIPTAAGFKTLLPGFFGGLPTGARGTFRARAPRYAALASLAAAPIWNFLNPYATTDPNGSWLSGFTPEVGYNPAVLGAEPGFFGATPMIYENVPGEDIPYVPR